jgi:hypothetical protein
MTGYTSEEITQAVSSLVQASISRPNDTLGPKRSDVTFGDIQNAAAGVFLLYPKSPFYCIYLGSQRILQAVAAEASVVDSLLAAVQAVGRTVIPINDLTPLANATAALQALGAAFSTRTTGFSNIQAVPQYQQFSKNVTSFLRGAAGKAVKSNGQVVMTPQEARGAIPGLVSQLQAAHQNLVLSVTTLAGGEGDYNKVNLASVVAQSVITNASTLLQNHLNTLTPLQPAARLATIRQTVLDIIAAQSVVTQYGSNQGTVAVYDITGTGTPYSDSTDLAIPAVATASIAGPYNVQSPNQYLDLYMDGAGPTPRTLVTLTAINPTLYTFNANFLAASIPVDVLVGDYIYVKTGPNAGTRWTVSAIGPGLLTVNGVTTALADSPSITVEILPAPSAEVVLPFAQSATILGVVAETQLASGIGYLISDGTHPTRFPPSLNTPAANNLLIVKVGVTTYNCPLTIAPDHVGATDSVPRTAQQVCDDINAVLAVSGFHAVPYFPLPKFQGAVTQATLGGSSSTFTLVGGFSSFTALNVQVNDLINVTTGDPTQQGLWRITIVTSLVLTATMVNAGAAISQVNPITIQVGAPERSIKLVAINPTAAVAGRVSLSIVNDNGVGSAGAAFLGLSPGGTARSAPQTSKVIATYINQNTTVCTASAVFTPVRTIQGRTNQTNAFLLTLSILEQTVSTSVVGPTLNAPIAGAQTAGAQVGDYLVERTGAHPGTVWQLTVVSDFGVTATLVTGVGATQVSVQMEIGPNVPLASYSMVRVTSGGNAGDYYVDTQSFLDLTLVSTMPQPFDVATMQPLLMTVEVGPETVAIASKMQTTSSLVKVRGPAAAFFYLSGDAAVGVGVAGTTTFFQLPSVPQGIDVGDLLQFFSTNYALPSQFQTITAVNDKVLTLDGPIASNVSWSFGTTLPYARLHTGHVSEFSTFQAELLAWTKLLEQQPLYFTNLNAAINPLLANSAPTAVQVNTALTKVEALYGELTILAAETYSKPVDATIESILKGYTVIQQPQIDSLVRSYSDKGADRAIDLLLAGSFQLFFGLDPSSSSYAGAMQVAAREVAMNDLPVKKLNRTNTQTSRHMGSALEPDPEYNFDDSNQPVPDPLSPDQQADGS